jgi:hypothetical protein
MLALHEALTRYKVKEIQTPSSFALQCGLEEKFRSSYFDSS